LTGVIRKPAIEPQKEAKKRIVVVEDNDDQRILLDVHLSQLGFEILHLRNAEELEGVLHDSRPHLVITDIIFEGDKDQGLRTIEDLRESGILTCPVIFTTVRRDIEARLGAVRTGCDAFLVKPIDMAELSDLVLQITDDRHSDPYRVLIVDDDPEIAGYHKLIIEEYGISVEIVSDPMEVMGPISRFRPDVILMDVNMPLCSGTELASAIRQHATFVQLPIIFVTAETAPGHQKLATISGGDEFVSKPINPDVLIPSILSRAKRWRTLGLILARMRESESRFRAVAHSAPDAIVLADEKGRVIFWNQSAQKMFGYQPLEIVGQPLNTLVPMPDRKNGNEYFETLKQGSAAGSIRDTREMRGRRNDGSEFSTEISIASWVSDDQLYFIGMIRDISNREMAEEQMRDAREAADRANQAKSEFLSSMSHELRTPMNSILGFGQLLQTNPEEPLTETQAQCVNQVLNAGRHLLGLINEVLDLAKIESGQLTVSLETVHTARVVKESVELISSLADSRGITVELSCPDGDIPQIVADPARLRQVLLNVMSNAVKYNCDKGTVSIACRRTDDNFLRIGVSDTGPGIPEDRKEEVFRPFLRLGTEASSAEGTGIGLTITRRLVELMNGRIDFESTIGAGTTFWIDMPIASQIDPATHPGTTDPGENPSQAFQFEDKDARGRILYIEDNPTNLRLMEQIVDRIPGLAIISAHTGELGVELAKTEEPDIIVLDINLPGMDGYATLNLLKKDEATRLIPVIALSANVMPNDPIRGQVAGFFTYLTKPIRVDEIVTSLSGALKSTETS
jgi:PAS domain S-box-containing protein